MNPVLLQEANFRDEELPTRFQLGNYTYTRFSEILEDWPKFEQALYAAGATDDDVQIFAEDLAPSECLEDRILALRDLRTALRLEEHTISPTFISDMLGHQMVTETEACLTGSLSEGISKIAEEHTIDSLFEFRPKDGVKAPEKNRITTVPITLRSATLPPLPPVLTSAMPSALILKRHRQTHSREYPQRSTWAKVLPEATMHTEPGLDVEIGTGNRSTDKSGMSPQCRSRYLPKYSDAVLLINGEEYIVGSHSYDVEGDVIFNLDFKYEETVLSELFAAVAGEGLACATPSHELHQAISSLYADAILRGDNQCDVFNEREGADIQAVDQCDYKWNIDITTPVGIWDKQLKSKQLIALSKYDMAVHLIGKLATSTNTLIKKLIANSLASEHPAYFGAPRSENMHLDLEIQYQICDRVMSLSQGTVSKLAQTCYDAAIQLAIDDAKFYDPFEQGDPFSGKAKIIFDKIQELRKDVPVVIPPYPLGKVTPLPTDDFGIFVNDEYFQIHSSIFDNNGQAPRTRLISPSTFLDRYPASGITTQEDGWKICDILNENFLQLSEPAHRGPVQSPSLGAGLDGGWEGVNKIYSRSAIAQLAEIRADVGRAVHNDSIPRSDQWCSKRIYDNKVAVWYRVRDPPTSAEGYRVDWFAVSSFPVIGSKRILTSKGTYLNLWPRQRMRSQEIDLIKNIPRRLKGTLFSMLDKARTTDATVDEIMLAWQRLAITATSSTWASGQNYIACRYLSSAFSAPAPPFHKIADKFVKPKTFACLHFMNRVSQVISAWKDRNDYTLRCPLLGLPRAFTQLESYWYMWVPDEMADSNKHYTDCLLALYDEAMEQELTRNKRIVDLQLQLQLIQKGKIYPNAIYQSMDKSTKLETGGKFGWNVFGALASAHALSLRSDPRHFDKSYSKGTKAKKTTDHLTVRHSAYLTKDMEIKRATVAEAVLKTGLDDYLTTAEPMYRLLYGRAPFYFNHPKSGEHKDREISIAEPDARIGLNKAESISSAYGLTTGVDLLKRPDKDSLFYASSAKALEVGGAISSTDASRYSPMMSNLAVAICHHGLGCIGGSTHLRGAAVIYRRLASRVMLFSYTVLEELDKRIAQDRPDKDKSKLISARRWITDKPVYATSDRVKVFGFQETCHTGQGMSHCGTSIGHAGSLAIAADACLECEIKVNGIKVKISVDIYVTSDDATTICTAAAYNRLKENALHRADKQRASHLFLGLMRHARQRVLRLFSIVNNEAKEKKSGVSGEFNCWDQGIGRACPILGYRELVSQLVEPSASSLIGDYLAAYAYGQTVAYAGQGCDVASVAQRLYLDAVEARWRLTKEEKTMLRSCTLIPPEVKYGASPGQILSGPATWLDHKVREGLMQISRDHNSDSEEINPHSTDSVYAPLSHVRVKLRRMHRNAIDAIQNHIAHLNSIGRVHQAHMLQSSLHDTLSSARSRGLGRVGARVRLRHVTPGEYRGCTFQKAPIVESTLNWYFHLEKIIPTIEVDDISKDMAVSECAHVKVARVSRYQYPSPITRRRFVRPKLKKPIYLINGYGQTPIGQHVIERAKATVVDAIGKEERKTIQDYYSAVNYRKFTEHATYGRSFVISWHVGLAGVVTPLDIAKDATPQITEGVKWGDYSPDAIMVLRTLESQHEGYPLLPLMYRSEGYGHYHCIYKGNSYYIKVAVNDEPSSIGEVRYCTTRRGEPVVIAYQGESEQPLWSGTAPTSDMITAFQNLPEGTYSNSTVEMAISKIEEQPRLIVPQYACYLGEGPGRTLLTMQPSMRHRPKGAALPYHRARCLAELAMGGYWYQSKYGVSVRAFMAGYCGSHSVWPAPVLGWRITPGMEPVYAYTPPPGDGVQSFTVLWGVDNEEILGRHEQSVMGNVNFVASPLGGEQVDKVVQIPMDAEKAALILRVNDGVRMPNGRAEPCKFIDVKLPQPRVQPANMTPEEAARKLMAKDEEPEIDLL